MACEYKGADWLAEQLKYKNRRPGRFGEQLADILGDVFRGIYHIDEYVLREAVEWENEQYIELVIDRELATYDGSELTHLVLRCHAESVRMAIRVEKYHWKYDGRRGTKWALSLIFHAPDSTMICGKHPMLRSAMERHVGPFCTVCQGASRTCTHCFGSGHEPKRLPVVNQPG